MAENIINEKRKTDINQLIDPLPLLEFIDYYYDKVQVEDNCVRGFCPVHKEINIRTLKIDLKEKTFKCSFLACPGNKGGNLLDLLCLSLDISETEALRILSDSLGVPVEFDTLFPDEEEFFRQFEQKSAEGGEEEIQYLLENYRQTDSYKKSDNKKRLLELIPDEREFSPARMVFSDMWESLVEEKNFTDLLNLAEKYSHLLESEEQFDMICHYLEKENRKRDLLTWYKRKVRWIKEYKGENKQYFETLEKIFSSDRTFLDFGEGFSLLNYYATRKKIPLKKVRELGGFLLKQGGELQDKQRINDIQNLLIKLQIISPIEKLSRIQEELKKAPASTFPELELILNSITEEKEKKKMGEFLRKNINLLVEEAPSSLVIAAVNVLVESGILDSAKLRKKILSSLQKRSSENAFSEKDYIFLMERLLSGTGGKEKIDFLFRLFDYFVSLEKLEKMQKVAADLFSLCDFSAPQKWVEVWRKIARQSNSSAHYEWLYQKTIQYFPDEWKARLLAELIECLPSTREMNPLRLDILEKLLLDYHQKSTTLFIQYLELLLAGEGRRQAAFPQTNFFSYYSEYRKSSEFKETFITFYRRKDQEWQADIARELVLLLEKQGKSDDARFWLEQYLWIAEPEEEPFFYIDKASDLFQYAFDRQIFEKTLSKLQTLTDASHFARFVKKGYEYYLAEDAWQEVKRIFEKHGRYLFLTFSDFKKLLQKARDKKDAEFFLRIWDKYFRTFVQEIPSLPAKTMSFYLQSIQPGQLASLLEILVENNLSKEIEKILSLLLEIDSSLMLEKAMKVVPCSLWNKKTEQFYVDKLLAHKKTTVVLSYYNRKVNHLMESRQLDEAREYYEKIQQLAPQDVTSLEKNAELEEKIGNIKKARQQYEQMYEIYLEKDSPSDAMGVLIKMQELFPEDVTILERKMQIADHQNDRQTILETYRELATCHEKENRISQARDLYLSLYERFSPPPLYVLKKLYKFALLGKQGDEAHRFLREILAQIAGESSQATLVKYIRPLLSLKTDDIELLKMYTESLLATGKKQEAYKYLKKAAEIKLKEGNIPEAIVFYEKTLDIKPSSINIYVQLGELYHKKGMSDKSLHHYYEAARISYDNKRIADSINILKKALEENPFDLKCAEFMADLYKKSEKPAQALPLYIAIAQHYEGDENYEEAFSYYRQAIEVKPQQVDLRMKALACVPEDYSKEKKRQLYRDTLFLLCKKKEVSLLQELHERINDAFGMDGEAWEELFKIYTEEQLAEPSQKVLSDLLAFYKKIADEESLLKQVEHYLQVFPPFPGIFQSYLPALYKKAPERFFENFPDWAQKYGTMKEFKDDFLKTLQGLLKENPADYLLLEEGIRYFSQIGEQKIGWEHFRHALEFASDNEKLEQFAAIEDNLLQYLPEMVDRFSDLFFLSRKNPAYFLQSGRKIIRQLISDQDIARAMQALNTFLEYFPDDIELNSSLLQLYLIGNDEIGAFEQTRRLAGLYEEKEDYEQAYLLYSNVNEQSNESWIEDKMISLLLKQGEKEKAVETLRQFSDKAFKEKQFSRSCELLEKGSELKPDDEKIIQKLVKVRKALGMEADDLAKDYLRLASIYKEAGEPAKRRGALHELVQIKPECQEYWMEFFECLEKEKEYIEIFRFLPRCLSSLAEEEVHDIYSFMEKKVDKIPLPVLLSVLDILPVDLAEDFIPVMKGAFPGLEEVRQGLEYSLDKENLFLFVYLFELYVEKIEEEKDLEREKDNLQKCLDFAIEKGLLEEAMTGYRLLIRLHPFSPDKIRDFLEIAGQLGIPPEEEIQYHLQLARAWLSQDKPEKAFDAVERILSSYPDNLELLELYVEIYPMIGMEMEIVESYRQLARGYQNQDPEKSRFYWSMVCQLLPDDKEAKRALEKEEDQ